MNLRVNCLTAVLGLAIPLSAVSSVFNVYHGQSIQAAVGMASDGDTILIHDGAYTETVVPYGKILTISSLLLIDGDTCHVASTVLTPDHARPDTGSCVVYAYGEGSAGRLVGLTLA